MPAAVRDTVLLIAGLIGLGFEATQHGAERPTFLMIYAAMIGLPGVVMGLRNGKNKS